MTESRHDLYVGCEVVCIDDKVPLMGGAIVKDKAITEGDVYTIEWIGIVNNYVFGEYLGVRLKGVNSRFGAENAQPHTPYNASRFRPLVKDPLAWAKRIATDPEFKPSGDEGPLHPDGPLPEPKRVKETEDV